MLLYYLVILPLSYMPFGILYAISDFLYVVVYELAKYRREVVATNLAKSFPTKDEAELLRIERAYYRHMCDLIVESLKGFTISYRAVQKRMKILNPEVLDAFIEKKRRLVLVGGHYGNWEMFALAIDRRIKHQATALYTPLSDQFMDSKVRKSRSKYGLQMLSIHEIREQLASTQEELTATIFGSDQSPGKSQRAYWMTFLNQETAVQFGTEKFAVEYDMPVIYGEIKKVTRGHFEVEFKLITDNPTSKPLGWITQKHTRMLEEAIEAQPEYWLWSHKRWKRERPEGEAMNASLL